jgi:hypothetical protein
MRASCAVLALFAFGGTALADNPQNERAPLIVAIVCEHRGMFSVRHPWSLKVDGHGDAVLIVVRGDGDIVRRFAMGDRLVKLAREVATQKFFELPSNIGRIVSDGSTRRMTIRTRDREKTVTIRYVANGTVDTTTQRALRMWDAIRNSFDERDAFDSRPYDAALLKSGKVTN